ncbi:DNL zinc finger-domain-containing protein [Kockovaella imperatae]|uniref:DNL zinc finger-domain-containing protein n=1 Tax=Kockovaella imperatae TaxID=4999 RepID=A0A1Y1ULZ9_9TREE|nr:DNL zinc finger-domain-containing protein [Kockovaella imperatae]ORX38514.1 DNL zinc finger-domain-containing protein [Kockovaella imperatae]
MTFTCTHDDCGHRSTHEFARRSYERGLVLVQCPECKARHLIADHIGWFKVSQSPHRCFRWKMTNHYVLQESTEEGKLKTVEDLLRAKGEKIKKGKVNFDGDIEYFEG